MNIQINGRKKSSDTRKAERFFSERGISYHLRDLVEKPFAPREIEAVCRSIAPEDLIDKEGKLFRKRGLEHMVYTALEEIEEYPELIRMPVVRNGNRATVGYDPATWKRWIEESVDA